MNEYVEETNENKYLTLVPTNDSKEEIKKKKKKKNETLWIKIWDLIYQ